MTSSTRYDEIRNAADTLGLPETATMDAIKKSYRMLMVKWHPDRCKEDPQRCKEMAQKTIEAYRTIIDYCNDYEYSFRKADVERMLPPDDRWFVQFGDDPLWGRGGDAKNRTI